MFNFSGGIHPNDKKISAQQPIRTAPLFKTYLVPLQQHIGTPAKLLVKIGDVVLKGQKIAEPGGFVSSFIHAPTSGIVKALSEALTVTGIKVPAILIEADGNDTADSTLTPMTNWQNVTNQELKQRITEAGIVGMGGAAFPTQVKLSPPENKPIDTLIINAAECEPGITGDYRLMLEDSENLIIGIQILAKILQPKQIFIGIENNKPQAIKLLTEKTKESNISIITFQTRYPQGAEKQLIYSCTKREVPSGGLPMDIGCVVQNVATCVAIAEAVTQGKPLYERIVTITGTPVVEPSNWRVRIGTSYEDVLKLAKGVKDENIGKVISGGPMMGFSVYSLEIPITKASGCLYLLANDEISQFLYNPCICCGRCGEVCPIKLAPSKLSVLIENQRYDIAEKSHLLDCIECGCCTYICPAHRPIIQQIRQAKQNVLARRKKENTKI